MIVMQEGAGVRQMIEDELRRVGARLRDLDVKIELGLQESVTSAVRAGFGVTFISRTSVASDLADGSAQRSSRRRARARAGDLPRPCERPSGDAIRSGVRRVRPRPRSHDRPLVARRAAGCARASLGLGRPLLVASERWTSLDVPRVGQWSEVPSHRIEVSPAARLAARGRWRLGDRHGEGGVGGDRAAGRVGADDVLRRRVDRSTSASAQPDRRMVGERARRAPRRDRLRGRAHPRPAARLRPSAPR